jgi:fructose-bisphosphate aldolase class I
VKTVSNFDQQLKKIRTQDGFIAALDQSGGSTPQALALYGITEEGWSGEEEMFDIVHAMRTRIIVSPAFNGDRILGAILFENTIERRIQDRPTAEYLWEVKNVVPILKIDKGLAEEDDGVQLMKPIPDLDVMLKKAKSRGIFGTKMRSVIRHASETGIKAVVAQQFDIGKRITAAGLVPIIEPEVNIHCPEKGNAETILKREIMTKLEELGKDDLVMLKLTLAEEDNLYREAIDHAKVLKVAALSGGYSREEAVGRLASNNGMIASFSRALVEGLSVHQSNTEFNSMLDESIECIYQASLTPMRA